MKVLTLEDFFTILRHQGLNVGVREYTQLQTIFKTQPALDRAALFELFCTVLAKNEAERTIISRVFNAYLPEKKDSIDDSALELSPFITTSKQHTDSRPNQSKSTEKAKLSFWQKQRKRLKERWPQIAALIVLIVVSIALLINNKKPTTYSPSTPQTDVQKTTVTNHPTIKPIEQETSSPLKLVKEVEVWTVDADATKIVPRDTSRELWLALLLFASTSLAFIWLLWKVIDKTKRREPPTLELDPKSRRRLSNPPTPFKDTVFNTQQRAQIAWGVSHYISDEQDNSVDLDETVRQSALQGLPRLCFNPIQREREVWLWRDNLAENQQQHILINDIKSIFQRLNIHIRHGSFNQLPYQVSDEQGQVSRSIYDALPTQQPLLLICLDSDSVSDALIFHHQTATNTLQQLKQWQHLALIDCSETNSSLKPLLAQYELPYLRPHQVPDWFTSQGRSVKLNPLLCHTDDLMRWAAACALYPYNLERNEVMALHTALGFNCAWKYDQLARYAQENAQGYSFWPQRHQSENSQHHIFLLNTLSTDAENRQRAIQFWQKHLEALNKHNKKQASDWEKSRQYHQLIQLPKALLKLWSLEQLPKAANTLHSLSTHKILGKEVHALLGAYTCADMPCINDPQQQQYIHLPYSWHDIEPDIQQQLLSVGFAGFETKTTKLVADMSSALLLGGLLGFAGFGAYCMVDALKDRDPNIKTAIDSFTPKTVVQSLSPTLQIGTPRSTLYTQATALDKNQTAVIKWNRQVEYAQEQLDATSQLWRLGTTRTPRKRDPDSHIAVSLVIIAEKPNADTQILAANLLDSGSADQVLISPYWKKHISGFKSWKTFPPDKTQWLYIGEKLPLLKKHSGNHAIYYGSAKDLLSQLNQAKQGKQDLETLGFATSGKPYFYNTVKLDNKPKTITLFNGTKLLPIPAGRFEMGSNNGDDNEKPVHTVTIKQPFWMAETENTFEQYDAYVEATGSDKPKDEGWGRGNRPVINVNWRDVQGYVQWLTDNNQQGLICRLPSEAEWEYAARAGTTTTYHWGNELVKNQANCGVCGSQWDRQQTAPVGSFKPNAWGLYDISGNVYEWTQDKWHSDYTGAPDDGSAWEIGESERRVLRGGSWFNSSVFVRSSARRNFSLVDNRNFLSGFRIVCSPPLNTD